MLLRAGFGISFFLKGLGFDFDLALADTLTAFVGSVPMEGCFESPTSKVNV